MIGFIGTSVTISLNYKQYNTYLQAIHTSQCTAAPALGFSVSTSQKLVMRKPNEFNQRVALKHKTFYYS
jgi:hypothetical protein